MIVGANYRSYWYDFVGMCIEAIRNLMIKKLYDCEIYLEVLKMDNHIYDMFLGENNFEEQKIIKQI